jgi:hemoglobin
MMRPHEKSDIATREDLEQVLTAFYQQVFRDDVISHFFTTVIPLDMAHHLPVITDFWEAVVFNKHSYSKNVMAVHQHIHHLSEIKKEHLDLWVQLFTQTIDAQFSGSKTELMKQRAASIATLMHMKLSHPRNK